MSKGFCANGGGGNIMQRRQLYKRTGKGKAVTINAKSRSVRIRVRLRRIARRFRARAQSGQASIEFAFIAPIFFVLLLGTMEVGIMYFAQFVLQSAVTDAARQIRTGQVAAAGMTQTQFRTYICGDISPILACDSNLQIDVESYSNFSTATIGSPLLTDNTLNTALNNYSPGTVCSVVVVRAFYTWSVLTPLLTPFMVNMANDQHLLTATAAFRNEPYTTGVSGC